MRNWPQLLEHKMKETIKSLKLDYNTLRSKISERTVGEKIEKRKK